MKVNIPKGFEKIENQKRVRQGKYSARFYPKNQRLFINPSELKTIKAKAGDELSIFLNEKDRQLLVMKESGGRTLHKTGSFQASQLKSVFEELGYEGNVYFIINEELSNKEQLIMDILK